MASPAPWHNAENPPGRLRFLFFLGISNAVTEFRIDDAGYAYLVNWNRRKLFENRGWAILDEMDANVGIQHIADHSETLSDGGLSSISSGKSSVKRLPCLK